MELTIYYRTSMATPLKVGNWLSYPTPLITEHVITDPAVIKVISCQLKMSQGKWKPDYNYVNLITL